MVKASKIIEDLKERFPKSCEQNRCLFDDYSHHAIIMQGVAEKVGVPVEELIEFFSKGKEKCEKMEASEKALESIDED